MGIGGSAGAVIAANYVAQNAARNAQIASSNMTYTGEAHFDFSLLIGLVVVTIITLIVYYAFWRK